MTQSQLTRLINWVAMLIALSLLVLVMQHIYKRHFTAHNTQQNFSFDDLPTFDEAPVTADIDSIINQHVFGVVPKVTKPVAVVTKPKPKPKAAPKTRLNISLTGIIGGTTPETGIAMLEVDRGRTLVVAVGEMIGKTDAKLHQVLPGEILIDRDGTIESVKMVRKTLTLARLDTTELDSLPQPYIEQQAPVISQPEPVQNFNQNTSNKAKRETARAQRLAERMERAKIKRAEIEQRRAQFQQRRNNNEPMKSLPIPRALQRLN